MYNNLPEKSESYSTSFPGFTCYEFKKYAQSGFCVVLFFKEHWFLFNLKLVIAVWTGKKKLHFIFC